MPVRGPQRITAHAEKMLDGFNKHRNEWLTRKDIAVMIGKKRLTPYDIDLLELMAERDLIRMEQEEGYSREGYRWIYGIFDPDYEDDNKNQFREDE